MHAPEAGAGPDQRMAQRAHAAYAAADSHPVEAIQKNWLRNQLQTKHHIMGNVYGTHLPMRIKMEMNILSQVQRLPGLRSSHVGMDTILGRDETIDFEDFLGVPEMNEQELDMRHALEQKYGLLPASSVIGPPTDAPRRPADSLPRREGVAMRFDLC